MRENGQQLRVQETEEFQYAVDIRWRDRVKLLANFDQDLNDASKTCRLLTESANFAYAERTIAELKFQVVTA